MLMQDNPSNLNEIKEFCREKHWRCTHLGNVRGSEASVTILYDLDDFWYEVLTRAKTQLVIITISDSDSNSNSDSNSDSDSDGDQRYFL